LERLFGGGGEGAGNRGAKNKSYQKRAISVNIVSIAKRFDEIKKNIGNILF
jgi:hypothetical protein